MELREVTVERLEVAGLDQDFVAIAEDEGPEAVPFRLEQPAVILGQRISRLGQHRLDRWVEGQAHRATVPDRGGVSGPLEAGMSDRESKRPRGRARDRPTPG